MSENEPDDGKSIDHTDAETLRRLYHGEGRTYQEIADLSDVSLSTIYYWMDKHGVEARSNSESMKGRNRVEYAKFTTDKNGYEIWQLSKNDNRAETRVHQLLAIAGGENPQEVYAAGTAIHHKNGVKWDNRVQNLELKSNREHSSHHNTGSDHGEAKLTESDVREIKQSLANGVRQKELVKEYPVSRATISDINRGHTWTHVNVE